MGLRDSDEETNRVRRIVSLPPILLCLLVTASLTFADNWTLDEGGGVYWNSSTNLSQIRAWPATSNGFTLHSQDINWTWNESYSKTVNLSLVFHTPLTSGNAYLWGNLTKTRDSWILGRVNLTTILYNVSSYNQTSQRNCSFGDSANTYFYLVNLTNQTGIIACFDSSSSNGTTWTLVSSLNGSVFNGTQTYHEMGWGSISNQFTKTTYGSNEIYTINNVAFTTGTKYITRFEYETSMGSSGKFDIYAHSGSPQNVIDGSAQVYLQLDPWWNTSYASRFPINCSNMTAGTPIVVNGSQGFSIGGQSQVVWTTCQPELYLYYNNASDYAVADNTTQYTMDVEYGNASSVGDVAAMWKTAGAVAVYHMAQNSTLVDMVGYNNLAITGSAALQTINKTGYSVLFTDAGAGYFTKANPVNLPIGGGMRSVMVFASVGSVVHDYEGVVEWGTDATCQAYVLDIGGASTKSLLLGTYGGGPISTLSSASGDMFIGMTNTLGVTFFSNTTIQVGSVCALNTGTANLRIGTYTWDTAQRLSNTSLSEVRIYNDSKSETIINETFYNWKGTAGYGMLGTSETSSTASDINSSLITPANGTQYQSTTTSINFTFNCSGKNSSYFANITINGNLNISAIPTTNNTITGQLINFAQIGAYTAYATCYNGTDAGNSTTNTFYILNFAPNITQFSFTPNGSAYQLGPLAFNITYVDWENSTATLYYSVFKNGSNQTTLAGTRTLTNNTLLNVYLDYAGPFNPTDYWNVSVFVSDGGNQSATIMSNNTTIGNYFSNVSFSNTAAYADLNFQATLNVLISGAASATATFEFNGINHTSASATGPPLYAFVASAAAPAGNYTGNWFYTATLANGSTYTTNNTTSTIAINGTSGFYLCNSTVNTTSLTYAIRDSLLLSPVNGSLTTTFTWTGDDGVARTDTITQTNFTTSICISPSAFNHAAVVSEVATATGYLSYINTRVSQNYSSSVVSRTISLINTSYGGYYTFIVINQYNAVIPNAFVVITQGSTVVLNSTTDVSGSIYVALTQLSTYTIEAGATGYASFTSPFTAGPVTTNTITLQTTTPPINTTGPNSFLNNVSYSIMPAVHYFTTPTNLTYTVNSSNNSLLDWGMAVYYNGTLVSTQDSVVTTGGSMTYLANDTGIYHVSVWFQQQGFGNFTPQPVIYTFANGTGLGYVTSSLQTGTVISALGYYILALLLALMAAAFVSQYTMSGAAMIGMIVLTGFTFLWPDGVVINSIGGSWVDITTTMLTVMTGVIAGAVFYLQNYGS